MSLIFFPIVEMLYLFFQRLSKPVYLKNNGELLVISVLRNLKCFVLRQYSKEENANKIVFL